MKNCYSCIHTSVCKYWDIWKKSFPGEPTAKDFIALSELIAKECLYFKQTEEDNE